MITVISPGDRVSVERIVGGYYRGTDKGTALAWQKSGKLQVKLDKTGEVKSVQADRVKKIKDGLAPE